MRKYLIAIACLFSLPAMAADNFKPYSVPVANLWTNSWIGLQGGGAFSGGLNNPLIGGFDQDGYFGGVNIGTQTQYANGIVLGIELEGNYGKINGATAFGPIAINHETEAFGSLRARLGYATGSWHLYGLGGVAIATTNASISVPGFSTSDSKVHLGYVAGAGLEYAMARNWVLGAEYAYYNFGSENYAFAIAGPIGLVTAADFDFHTVKAKAAYRW